MPNCFFLPWSKIYLFLAFLGEVLDEFSFVAIGSSFFNGFVDMILVSNFGTTRQPPSQISHEFNPNFEFLSRMSSLCGIQFSFLFRDGYLIFSLDLLRFDVADLWPKFQFDSLNFEGIIRFEVSFFPLALPSFLTSVLPSFCSCTGKRREAGGYGWTR